MSRGTGLALMAAGATGCASLLSESGHNLAYAHGRGTWSFQTAYRKAAAACESRGLAAKLITTTCPARCVSSFECVAKPEAAKP